MYSHSYYDPKAVAAVLKEAHENGISKYALTKRGREIYMADPTNPENRPMHTRLHRALESLIDERIEVKTSK